jgi:pimeloyl-ACP methyl ester carboxylesterase
MTKKLGDGKCRVRHAWAAALLFGAALGAQTPARPAFDPAIATVAGSGSTTFVLISGIVGGVPGFRRLQNELVRRGHRVVIVDPYRMSADSADVTFPALARRTDAVLARLGVDSARVIGHAHGAGVALRLAALYPRRVATLTLLDAGALRSNQTKVFSSSLKLLPVIARIPGGKSFIKGQFLKGLRQNAASTEWLDDETERAYTQPLLDNVGKGVAMAKRLANAAEPEPVSTVVARGRVPVTSILGASPHPSAPNPDEVDALRALGPRFRVERLEGVGHFPHEEAPTRVADLLMKETTKH